MTRIQPRRSLWLEVTIVVTAVLTGGFNPVHAAGTLDIYWIDVEGGASTLIVTPGGQSVLMDTGFDGFNDRDASRIAQVVKEEAGLKRLDHVLISHFHADHVGGLAALSQRVEIASFIDHGETVEKSPEGRAVWDRYVAVAGKRRRTVRPGERLTFDGAELIIVAAHSQFVAKPLTDGARNPLCETFKPQPEDAGENERASGICFVPADSSSSTSATCRGTSSTSWRAR